MDFVYVRDLARSNIAALLSEATDESFNVGNQVETSLRQLLDVLLKVNNSTLQPEFVDESTVNPVSRRLADINKAREILHFEPTVHLEDGMLELSNWYFDRQQ